MPRGVYDRSKAAKRTKSKTAAKPEAKKTRKWGNRYTAAKKLTPGEPTSGSTFQAGSIDHSLLTYLQILVSARSVGTFEGTTIVKLDNEINAVLDFVKTNREGVASVPTVTVVKEKKTKAVAPPVVDQAPAPVPFNAPAQAAQ